MLQQNKSLEDGSKTVNCSVLPSGKSCPSNLCRSGNTALDSNSMRCPGLVSDRTVTNLPRKGAAGARKACRKRKARCVAWLWLSVPGHKRAGGQKKRLQRLKTSTAISIKETVLLVGKHAGLLARQ
jgi:hypothetical protein